MRTMTAEDIFLPPQEAWADWVIDRCCEDPEVWLTHGCPGWGKMIRIRTYIVEAIQRATVEKENR